MARGNKSSGYSNPMMDHHKKARQKELQRNKQKRTKERDEKAIQTKTIREVREEIQKLEKDMKRHNHGQQQKSTAEHKVARLQKELKLLQEKAAAAKAEAEADAEAHRLANKYRQPQRPLTELDDPRKSVYYDSVLNPYGAPPPGKPRLYHRRFGGVTLNPHEAVVPGEDPQIPPPPPPPPRDVGYAQQSHYGKSRGGPDHRQHDTHNHHHHQQQERPQRPHENRQPQQPREGSSSHSQTPPQRQPLHMPPPNKSQPNGENAKNRNDQNVTAFSTKEEKSASKSNGERTKPAPKPPPAIPSLPAPSQAVQRTMRVARNKQKTRGKGGGALADIWASTEEVEYERITNLVDLEADDVGTAKIKKKKKKKKKPPLEFYYRDTAGTVQGPFSKAQMRGWMDGGFFPLTTRTRTNRMDPDGWVAMGDLPALKEAPEAVVNNSAQDRIAALKGIEKSGNDDDGVDPSMQARIAAMRADLMASSAPEKPIDDAGNDESTQDRIAALRGNANNGDSNNDDDDGIDPSMQARIKAMRADLKASSATENPNDDATNDDSVQDRIAALSGDTQHDDNNNDIGIDPSMEARISAMRADLMASSALTIPHTDPVNDDIIQNRITALRDNDDVNNNDEGIDLSMQARIEAMRADLPGHASAATNQPIWEEAPPTGGETGNSSLQDRIAALTENSPPSAAATGQQHQEQNIKDETVNSSLQDRIAALRKNAPPPLTAIGHHYQEHNIDNETGNTSLQDRIAALRKNAPPPPPPPPPTYPVDTENHYSNETSPSAYPLGDADDDDDARVSAYPIDNEGSSGVAAYPTSYPLGDDDEEGMAAYPLTANDDTNDEDYAVAAYPTGKAYPGAEDLAYPVTDSYPVEDEGYSAMKDPPPYGTSGVAYPSEGMEGPSIVTSKKVVEIDKALVSFVPTNLLSKKRKVEEVKEKSQPIPSSSEATKHQKTMESSTKTKAESDDNYNNFLKEIDGL